MPKKNEIDDIWQWIDTRNGDDTLCWPWLGSLAGPKQDRAYFSLNGKRVLAHRIVYELVYGPIPDGKMIRHTCNTPHCCNPMHLVAGSQSENERDKTMTDTFGLPVAAVREIRLLLERSNMSQEVIAGVIARKYNIKCSREAVRNIKLGKRRSVNEMTAEELATMTAEEIKERLKYGD